MRCAVLTQALRAVVLLLVIGATSAIFATPAAALDCGGGVPCGCGDTVTSSITLDTDLGVCTGLGLRVKSGVTLDCAGHRIVGSDKPGAWYGVTIDNATGVEVRNCRVSKFRRGLRIRGGSNNVVRSNWAVRNRYGIDLANSTVGNQIIDNRIRLNRDEGIHVGNGSNGNQVIGNKFTQNRNENLYLLGVTNSLVEANRLRGSGKAAIYVKHSAYNSFTGNRVVDGLIQVRGESSNNVFEDNQVGDEGFAFEAYQEPDGLWFYPRQNEVAGGSILGAQVCFRFAGASDNHAREVVADGCKPMVSTPLGDDPATGNTVELIPPP